MKKGGFSVREMAVIAIMAAVICVAAPLCIPVPSGVPVSLATMAVYLSGALLGKVRGSAAVVVYIMLGAVGLPVFSGFMGGAAHIMGATGGFILGYIPCAFLTGLFAERFCGRAWATALGMISGTVVLYFIGTLWFILFTGSDFLSAAAACVLPFVLWDVLKMSAVCAVVKPIRSRLGINVSE